MGIWAIFVLGTGLLLVQVAKCKRGTDRCEPVAVDFCQDVSYKTRHPTGKKQYNLDLLRQIVDMGCSAETTTFLCHVVSPKCVDSTKPPTPHPCQELCKRVRRDCQPVLEGKGLTWPEDLNCEQYPERSCFNVSKIRIIIINQKRLFHVEFGSVY